MTAQYITPNNNTLSQNDRDAPYKKKKTEQTDCFTQQHIIKRIDQCTCLWQTLPNELNPIIPVLPLRISKAN